MTVTVDKGPANNSVNQPFVSVTICQPGSSTQCQTIDHILVDTGSTGLRILASAMSSNFQLNMVRNASSLPVLNCVNFLDTSYAWGPLVTADVRMGGEVANGLPIQVIGVTGFNSLGSACSSTGSALTTASDLGANGIIGVGLAPQDCGSTCDPAGDNVRNYGRYFACTTNSCTAVTGSTLATALQAQHPAVVLATDNNGVALVLPAFANQGAASAPGQTSMTGQLVFGLGTQANNAFSTLTVLRSDDSGYLVTRMPGNTLGIGTELSTSFLDSGSNGLFVNSSITRCSAPYSTSLYCPSTTQNGSATLEPGAGVEPGAGIVTITVSVTFSMTSAANLNYNYAVLPTFSGLVGYGTTFDWGLPFFYGRTVAFGISNKVAPGMGTGPFYAL